MRSKASLLAEWRAIRIHPTPRARHYTIKATSGLDKNYISVLYQNIFIIGNCWSTVSSKAKSPYPLPIILPDFKNVFLHRQSSRYADNLAFILSGLKWCLLSYFYNILLLLLYMYLLMQTRYINTFSYNFVKSSFNRNAKLSFTKANEIRSLVDFIR